MSGEGIGATTLPGSRPRVLRILGHGRSGSTALGMLVGGRPGACFVGEVGQAWNAFSHDEWQCGCGETVVRCPFWVGVRSTAFGEAEPDFERLYAIATERVRLRPAAIMRLGRPLGRAAPPERDYLEALGALHRGIAGFTGAGLIVDSSSSAPGALIASRAPGVDVFGLHLIRDPRGVAHSFGRAVAHLPGHGKGLARIGPLRTAIRWQLRNGLSEATVRPRLAGYARLRYESLGRDPAGALALAAELTGIASLRLQADEQPLLQGDDSHALDGNPRLLARRGPIPIRLDERWRREMSPTTKALVSVASLPISARYGYIPRRAV